MNQNTKPNKLIGIARIKNRKPFLIYDTKPNSSNTNKSDEINNQVLKDEEISKPNIYRDIDEEFDKKFVGITQGTKRVWWVDNPDRVLDFIHKQIDKTNREWEKKIEDLRDYMPIKDYEGCIKYVREQINNLLK